MFRAFHHRLETSLHTGLALVTLTLAMSALASPEAEDTMPASVENADPVGLDTYLGEVPWPDEAASTEAIVADIRETVRRHAEETGTARRDAHPKAHGCVHASFTVAEDLDPALAHGVFAPGAWYEAVIRFSNGSADPDRADIKGDARGMAIKLRGVPGPKLMPDEDDTQDFVMISNPTFFSADPADYRALVHRGTSRNPVVAATAPLALGFQGLAIAHDITSKKIASPLETRYWSTTPYRLGIGPDRQAVKYSARPCTVGDATIPPHPEHDYLRAVMADTLRTRAACFDFYVQPRAPGMSVEDPRIEWDEADAPFVRVARIDIPAQVFDTPEQDATCEALSFSPWHGLSEHRPLGGVNRVRRVVYETIAAERRELNRGR
jgi:hypothetical protein